mmetsp:Transcript_16263/g.37521  ORF Transcript_16263/g.37521 Transcript_16263/m.37521 type:complete len:147 (+) Transcript_16263:61-501(+)
MGLLFAARLLVLGVMVFEPVLATADCSDPITAPASCCEMERNQPCLFSSNEMYSLEHSSCSIACQRKYASLAYECYRDFKNHYQWALMEDLCDPNGIVKFTQGTTSRAPNSDADTKVSASSQEARPLWCCNAAQILALLCVIVVWR